MRSTLLLFAAISLTALQFTGCTDKNSREYTLDSLETTTPPSSAPAKEAPSGDGELSINIKGEFFKEGAIKLKADQAFYNEADGITVLKFKGMIEKDSAIVELSFIGDKAGKYEVGKPSGKGSGKVACNVLLWIPGADIGTKFFYMGNTGEINVTEAGSTVKGTFKGGASDIRAETPSDITVDGSFSIVKK